MHLPHFKAARNSSQLEHINFQGNDLHDTTNGNLMQTFCTALAQLTCLKTIDLSHSKFILKDAVPIFEVGCHAVDACSFVPQRIKLDSSISVSTSFKKHLLLIM